MTFHQFRSRLILCTTKEQRQTLYRQYPDLARQYKAMQTENKRQLPPGTYSLTETVN